MRKREERLVFSRSQTMPWVYGCYDPRGAEQHAKVHTLTILQVTILPLLKV